jgi:tetraacyldisaccharide 4'-kinase
MMSDRFGVDALWYDAGVPWRLARMALWPAEQAFRLATALRNAAYDSGLRSVTHPQVPTISIGNLSVGGTGKTPFAAFVASECAKRGARPAIVLRGYGGDEQLVHAALNPAIPVFVGADRLEAIGRAIQANCNLSVLDDGFQHRRVRRDLDVVLYSADRIASRVLPAGPLREPLSRLTRADLVVVTSKGASPERVAEAVRRAGTVSRRTPIVAELQPDLLHPWLGGAALTLTALAGKRVLLIAGIGDPAAFQSQIGALGADVEAAVFPDHHPFTRDDGVRLEEQGRRADLIVCTLKDAVKLGAVWPREAGGFHYVSQRVMVTEGASELASHLDRVVRVINPDL